MTETAPASISRVPFGERRTVTRLWHDAVSQDRATPAYLVQSEDGWKPVSWSDAAEHVDDYANGLLALGVRKGDAFAILAQTTLEWTLFDLALAQIGAVSVPIYANSSPRDVAYVAGHSESVGILAEDAAQLAKVEEHRDELPRLEHALTYADLAGLATRGRAYAVRHPDALAQARDAVDEDDLFTILYTSGTTGPPKGCMISHRNEYAMVSVVDDLDDFTVEGDVMLLYLPLAHNFGRLMSLSGPYCGYTIAFLPDPLQTAEALLEVRPTVFPSVPRVYEKVHTGVLAKFDEATGLKRRLVDWALGVGRDVSRLRRAGEPVPRSLAVRHRVADRLVYSKVKSRVGGRLRTAISGGAPLATEIAEFFHAIDILILEGYGLTESTTAISTNTHHRYRFGTVGPALPGFEVKLAEDGELLARSDTIFQGYYKDPEATAEVLAPDGWLRTGDIATIDDDGFITITDRKKDILVTSGGKNVAPQNLENDLKTSRWISQALVVGDRRPYVAALVTLDTVEIAKWAADQGIPADDVAALADDDRVRALVQRVVDDVNAGRSRYEQIKRFAVLPRDFTMADGEITPTLKLKRRVAQEHFQDAIVRLYAADPPSVQS
jgi:long-chain acyl-CoA synthetase